MDPANLRLRKDESPPRSPCPARTIATCSQPARQLREAHRWWLGRGRARPLSSSR